MNSRVTLLLLGTIAVLLIAGGMLLRSHLSPPPKIATPDNPKTVHIETARFEAAPKVAPTVPPAPVLPSAPSPAAPPKRGKPPAQDPAARAALSLVGTDSTAELVWLDAINNPRLPAQERQDLIEDLNEDGFSNKKQPTRVDLPLIKARLALIDRLAPDAMDKTNAEAFAEARKDLVNMLTRLDQ